MCEGLGLLQIDTSSKRTQSRLAGASSRDLQALHRCLLVFRVFSACGWEGSVLSPEACRTLYLTQILKRYICGWVFPSIPLKAEEAVQSLLIWLPGLRENLDAPPAPPFLSYNFSYLDAEFPLCYLMLLLPSLKLC